VIANGFLMGDALAAVAGRFPNTKLAIIDYPWAALKGKPQKLARARLRGAGGGLPGRCRSRAGEQEFDRERGGRSGGSGCRRIPRGLPGGATATKRSVKVLSGYSQDFVDQAKCKELALDQLSRGSDVVFAAAGGCGLGALQAAKERSAWRIGVDNDHSFLGPAHPDERGQEGRLRRPDGDRGRGR
jgi:basic membrane protein A